MNDIIEQIEQDGYTISLYYDQDCTSPRDSECNFLFLGLSHRRYDIGDETIDVDDYTVPCDTCKDWEGPGYRINSEGEDEDCPDCQGEGTRHAVNLNELRDAIQAHYGARVCLPVGMIDHSGVSYYIGGGPHSCDPGGWDSGTCGFILDTPAILKLQGNEDATNESLIEWMTSEIDEYSKWASGDCYGYVIEDVNGTHVDSCWGFIGYDYARQEAIAACPSAPVEPLITVKMTRAQLTDLEAELFGCSEAWSPLITEMTQFYCQGCGRVGTEDDLCELDEPCPDEECDGIIELYVPYPECAKMLAVKEQSQAIGEFLDWAACEKGWHLAEYEDNSTLTWPRMSTVSMSTEHILAAFFDIDLNKVEREQRAMLEALR